jgi:hypothetical protein
LVIMVIATMFFKDRMRRTLEARDDKAHYRFCVEGTSKVTRGYLSCDRVVGNSDAIFLLKVFCSSKK